MIRGFLVIAVVLAVAVTIGRWLSPDDEPTPNLSATPQAVHTGVEGATRPAPTVTTATPRPTVTGHTDNEPAAGGSPAKTGQTVAARFVTVWLSGRGTGRNPAPAWLAALRPITAPALYAGLAYTAPYNIPAAKVTATTPVVITSAGDGTGVYRVALSDKTVLQVQVTLMPAGNLAVAQFGPVTIT